MSRLEDILIDPFSEEVPKEKLKKLGKQPLEKVQPTDKSQQKEPVSKKKSKNKDETEKPKFVEDNKTEKEQAEEKPKPLVIGSEKSVLEAALFMSPNPIKLEELGKISGIGSVGYLKKVLEDLSKDYENRGIEIVEKNGYWAMQVRAEYINKVSNLTPYSDLSDGCKRTLALIVYKDPIKQSEIINMQGNKAYSYIKTLVKRGLITTEKIGRTKILKLTREFENYFGEEIEKVKERVRAAIAKEQAEKNILIQ